MLPHFPGTIKQQKIVKNHNRKLKRKDVQKSACAVARKTEFKRSTLARSGHQHLTLPRVSPITAMTAMTMSMPVFTQSFSAEIENLLQGAAIKTSSNVLNFQEH